MPATTSLTDLPGEADDLVEALAVCSRPGPRVAALARRPAAAALIARHALRLPTVPIDIPHDRLTGAWRESGGSGLLPGWTLCQAVADIPATAEEFFRGRSRQALRTNANRAARAGAGCLEVPIGTELRQRLDPTGSWSDPRWLIVAGLRYGEPEGYSVCWITGEWAFLTLALSGLDSPPGLPYLLHREMIVHLIERGVNRLHGGPSVVPRSQAYFLARLGYRPVNLRWVQGRSPRRSAIRGLLPRCLE